LFPTPTGLLPLLGRGEGTAEGDEDGDSRDGAQSKSLWDRFRLAQVDQGKNCGGSSVEKRRTDFGKKAYFNLKKLSSPALAFRAHTGKRAGCEDLYAREDRAEWADDRPLPS